MIRLIARVYEAVCIFVASAAVGGGIGFAEGCIVFRHSGVNMFSLAAFCALWGQLVSLLVGPFVYYVLLRGAVSFARLAHIVLVSLAIGSAAALALGPAGWMTWVVTPLAAVGASIVPSPIPTPRERS
jgi:hypothetical protein